MPRNVKKEDEKMVRERGAWDGSIMHYAVPKEFVEPPMSVEEFCTKVLGVTLTEEQKLHLSTLIPIAAPKGHPPVGAFYLIEGLNELKGVLKIALTPEQRKSCFADEVIENIVHYLVKGTEYDEG